MKITPTRVLCDYCEAELEEITDTESDTLAMLAEFYESIEEGFETYIFCDRICKTNWEKDHEGNRSEPNT